MGEVLLYRQKINIYIHVFREPKFNRLRDVITVSHSLVSCIIMFKCN